jgi:CheY-like chemotaxis protein
MSVDGFELARMIRNHPRFQQTAIIFVSAVALTEPIVSKGLARVIKGRKQVSLSLAVP